MVQRKGLTPDFHPYGWFKAQDSAGMGGLGEELTKGCIVCSQLSVLHRHNSQHSSIKTNGQIKRSKTVWQYTVKTRRERMEYCREELCSWSKECSSVPCYCTATVPHLIPLPGAKMAPAAPARRRLLGDGLRRKSQKQQEKEQGIFSLPARVGGHWGAPSHVRFCAVCCSDTLLWICLPLTFP